MGGMERERQKGGETEREESLSGLFKTNHQTTMGTNKQILECTL